MLDIMKTNNLTSDYNVEELKRKNIEQQILDIIN